MNDSSGARSRPARFAPLAALALLLATLVVLGTGGPSSALPCLPDIDPGCTGPTFTTYDATLTVTRTGGTPGTVSSDAPSGRSITCGSVCAVTDSQTTADTQGPPAASSWPTYTLTATGPAGYTPQWIGCDRVDAQNRCVVANDDWVLGTVVSVAWVDVTPPLLTFTPPAKIGPSSYLQANATDATGPVARYYWSADGGPFVAAGSSYSAGWLSSGTHTLRVYAVDAASLMSTVASATVVMDKSVSLVLGDLPAYVDGSAPTTLTFGTDDDVPTDGAHRTCSLDGGTPGPCTTPTTFTLPADTPEGAHELTVAVTDDVANLATATRTVTVDRTAPAVAITGGPDEGGTLSGPAAEVAFTATDLTLATVTCAVDAQAPTDCAGAGKVAVGDLPDGAHSVTVTATDQVGHTTTVVRHFTRTHLTPSMSVAATPATYGETSTFTVTLPAAATGTITIRSGSLELCAAQVHDGVATCAAGGTLAAGTHALTAVYSGDAVYASGTHDFDATWGRAATTTATHPGKSVTRRHHAVLLVATVGPGAPGKVVFSERGHRLCSARVVKGTAACSTSTKLPVGVHKVLARYSGSANYLPSQGRTSFRIR